MAEITDPGSSAGFGSHLPVLRAAVEATKGPVLELGGGLFSTAYLDSLNTSEWQTKRKLATKDFRLTVTVEKNPDWKKYLEGRWPNHTYVDTNPDVGGWSVTLIDNGDATDWYETRWQEVLFYKDRSEIVLMHDAIPWRDDVRGDEHLEIVKAFNYSALFYPRKEQPTPTLALSREIDVRALLPRDAVEWGAHG